MKSLFVIILVVIFGIDGAHAQFTNPAGYTGRLRAKTKRIRDGGHSYPAGSKAIKWTTSNRRYDLDITFRNSAWYSSGGCGWNKIGRITFVRYSKDNMFNHHKIHVGWKAVETEHNKIHLALFFHDGPEDDDEHNWVAHKMNDTINTQSKTAVDMFLGHSIIAMIIDDKALGIRKNGWIPDTKRSFLSKTFYFGGTCGAPHYMQAYFEDQKYDWSGYGTKFNSQSIITWNLTEFDDGDSFSYFAEQSIVGSTKHASDVQFNGNHPDPIAQKCIIHDGAEISFAAGKRVHLYPGFHAKPGSYFRAVIGPPAKININQIPQVFDEQISYDVDNVKSVELSLYIDSTLDSVVYGKQFYVNPHSSIAKTTIDTILPLKKYYVVANLYSGKGSQKRIEGWVTNNKYNAKNSLSNTLNVNNSSGVSIYPNPTEGIFNIKLKNFELVNSIKVLNTKGQIVFINKPNSASITIDISNQVNGMYIILVQTNVGVETYKLVKN